jgi:hypothetical protein
MARPRKVYSTATESELRARVARGESAKTIHAALRGVIPLSTIDRRLKELRSGGAAPPRALPAAAPPAVDVPAVIPPNASETEIDEWMGRLKRAVEKAEVQENWAMVASLTAKYVTLEGLKFKHAPLPVVDPSAGPDYKALAAVGRDRFLKLVEGVFNESARLRGEEGGAPP